MKYFTKKETKRKTLAGNLCFIAALLLLFNTCCIKTDAATQGGNIDSIKLSTAMADQTTMSVSVSAKRDYTKAYQVLSLVNKKRKAAGVGTLVMDKDLLETAMLRAAECSIVPNHIRPNGEICYYADEKMYGENVSFDFTTASSVMKDWMESPIHKFNILNSSYVSIGIGCVKVNNRVYWVQCFGCENVDKAAKSSYKNKTVAQTIEASPSSGLFKIKASAGKKTLSVGKKTTIAYKCGSATILSRSLKYKSSNTSVCKVNAKGKVTALKKGTATITVYPSNCSGAAKKVKIKVK
ncbi:MAG: CAP domain-containing protein [Lachnospiraceae bacterium]|nr:CAP domain-containing protein [Lachnospiraceae bacterium]